MTNKLLRWLTVSLTLIISLFFTSQYGIKSNTFYGDALGYYLYLPSTFIYHNLAHVDSLPGDKKIPDGILNNIRTLGQSQPAYMVNGHYINQYTYGVALMELPFFMAAHVYELATGARANGYTKPYEYALKLGALVYALLGMLLTFKILKRYFSPTLSLLTVLAIFTGSNLFWFSLSQAGMSHPIIFFLYALLIYLSIILHERPSLRMFMFTGLTAGLITIIRPSDIICLLIPLLYNVYNGETIKNKARFIAGHPLGLLLFALSFAAALIPQMLYWNAYTGSFLYYSYGSQAFLWSDPKIIPGLFYYKNGWLPYSMIMVFSLTGLVLYKYIKPWAWCLWLLVPLYVYIIYSWYCYTYINGFGSRPMIHIYPLLALPLGAFMKYISGRKMPVKFIFAAVCLFFISVNVSNCMQQANRILCSENSNMVFNMQTLYKMQLSYRDFVCMDNGEVQPRNDEVVKVSTLGCQDYNDSSSDHFVRAEQPAGGYAYHMLNGEEYQPLPIKVAYDKQKFGDARWLKGSGKFKCTTGASEYEGHLLTMNIVRNDKTIKWKACKVDNKIGIAEGSDIPNKKIDIDHFEAGKWGTVYFYIKIPEDIQQGDIISLDMWSVGKIEIYLDDLCLELYK